MNGAGTGGNVSRAGAGGLVVVGNGAGGITAGAWGAS